MVGEPFSIRNKSGEAGEFLLVDIVPTPAREALIAEVSRVVEKIGPSPMIAFEYRLYRRMRALIWSARGKESPMRPEGGPLVYYIPDTIRVCKWYEFYDICELVYVEIAENPYTDDRAYIDTMNGYFKRYRLAWKYNEEGLIVRVRSEQVDQAIAQAKYSLSGSLKFVEAKRQFSDAIEYLDRVANPDYETVVMKCSGAIEAMVKAIAGRNGDLVGLIKKPPFTEKTHPILREIIEKVYAFRGDQAAHPKPEGSSIGREEAEFIISLTASVVTYLATKFSA